MVTLATQLPGCISPILGSWVSPWGGHWCIPDRDYALCGATSAASDEPCAICEGLAFGGADWRDLHGFEGEDS